MTRLAEFFQEDLPRQMLADLEEQRELRVRLHAAERSAANESPPAAAPRLPRLGQPAESPPVAGVPARPALRLASLPGKAHTDLLRDFADADSRKRREMLAAERPRLFSIVFANYRPGPAWLPGHNLADGALSARISPGGETWQMILEGNAGSDNLKKLGSLARHCCRLDKSDGVQAGSGFVLPGGMILTARHVIFADGWLLGNPPDAAANPAWLRFGRLNGAKDSLDKLGQAMTFNDPFQGWADAALLAQNNGWQAALAGLAREFGSLPGLELEVAEPIDLPGKKVAVVGHPGSGNSGGTAADIPIVYGDAPLGTKRLMPGILDFENPMVMEQGLPFLNHDCSTLGGASGSCLIDLETRRVLGIHVRGDASMGNRAVPAWEIHQRLFPAAALT